MEEIIVTFDDDSRKDVVEALDLTESEDVLVDSGGLVITDQNFEEVKLKNFGGVLRGSKIFINNDSAELVKFFSSRLD